MITSSTFERRCKPDVISQSQTKTTVWLGSAQTHTFQEPRSYFSCLTNPHSFRNTLFLPGLYHSIFCPWAGIRISLNSFIVGFLVPGTVKTAQKACGTFSASKAALHTIGFLFSSCPHHQGDEAVAVDGEEVVRTSNSNPQMAT